MPGLDGTGPWGAGPMTGGSRGLCNPAWRGAHRPWYGRGRGYGRGWFGWGRGYGRGWGWRAYGLGWAGPYLGPRYGSRYGMSPTEEAETLKAEAEDMKRALDEISKRIEELEREQQTQT